MKNLMILAAFACAVVLTGCAAGSSDAKGRYGFDQSTEADAERARQEDRFQQYP
jgi:hypothetical protein